MGDLLRPNGRGGKNNTLGDSVADYPRARMDVRRGERWCYVRKEAAGRDSKSAKTFGQTWRSHVVPWPCPMMLCCGDDPSACRRGGLRRAQGGQGRLVTSLDMSACPRKERSKGLPGWFLFWGSSSLSIPNRTRKVPLPSEGDCNRRHLVKRQAPGYKSGLFVCSVPAEGLGDR